MLYKYLLFIIVSVSLFGLSCGQSSKQEYDIDKTSPDGVYRVKIEVRAKPPKGTRDYMDYAKVQFFKEQEIIYEYEWEQSDQFEPSFHDCYPVIEWTGDNVLRMGEDRSDQPFYYELIVSNNTDEYLKYFGVSHDRYESFEVFDLAPKSQVTLQASPGFNANGTISDYVLGYGGMAESGKKFHGAMESKKRKSIAEGPLKFQITITSKDLQ